MGGPQLDLIAEGDEPPDCDPECARSLLDRLRQVRASDIAYQQRIAREQQPGNAVVVHQVGNVLRPVAGGGERDQIQLPDTHDVPASIRGPPEDPAGTCAVAPVADVRRRRPET